MKIKIEGGTASHGENLCVDCRWHQSAESESGKIFAKCNLLETRLFEPVVRCKSYDNINTPSLYDMKELAWIINPDGHKNPVGFTGSSVTITKYSELDEKQKRRVDSEEDW
jgi:hypothetical protein